MPKEKIAIISVLKPVDDIRSYHKMAKSLLTRGKYEMHFIGFASQDLLKNTDDCYFHSHDQFDRLSFKRLLTPFKILWTLTSIRPKQIICNSPELLWVSAFAKVLLGTRIIYDIQENYKFNLWFQDVYPPPIKQVLGLLVRAIEYIYSMFFDHFILAEQCYADELGFVGNRYTVLENKSLIDKDMMLTNPEKSIDLLFSGTITTSNGIFHALDVWKKIKQHQPSISLKIIGHCSDERLFEQLKEIREDGLLLDISQHPIPYVRIIEAMTASKFGLVLYDLNPSNERCMPTKVFDYMTYKLPIIFETGAGWEHFIEMNRGGIPIDLKRLDTDSLLRQMDMFDTKRINDKVGLWEEEAVRFIELMRI